MSTRNTSDVKIKTYKCCQCQEVNRGVIAPGHYTQCRECSHPACTRCGYPSSGEQNQIAEAQIFQSPEPLHGSLGSSRTPTVPMRDYFGRGTPNYQDSRSLVSVDAGLSSTTLYPSSSDVLVNPMAPPPMPGGYSGELSLRNLGHNVPGIPGPYQAMESPYRSLPPSPHHQFFPARRAARRPDPLHMANIAHYRGPSSAVGEMQTPPSSSTSAYFSDSAMSGSLPASDNEHLQSDNSWASLTGEEESLTANEQLPAIPLLPSPRLSRAEGLVPRRPTILSEKSPKRPMLRKPKGPLPPRAVKPGDPKDFKTAQNTIAARGTRQRKNDSQLWLLRYRDETKDYIRDLEHVLTERNERIAFLERENNGLRQLLNGRTESNPRPESIPPLETNHRPGTLNLSRYDSYTTLSDRRPSSFDDYTTAGTGTATPLERVRAGTAPTLSRGPSASHLSRHYPLHNSSSADQLSLDIYPSAGPSMANTNEGFGASIEQSFSGSSSANELSRNNSFPDTTISRQESFDQNLNPDPTSAYPGEKNDMEGTPEGHRIPFKMEDVLFADNYDFDSDPDVGQGYDLSHMMGLNVDNNEG